MCSLKVLAICFAVTGCVTSTITQSGTQRLFSGTSLYEQFEPLYGVITLNEMVDRIGQPTIVSRRDNGIVGLAYDHKRVECMTYSALVYEKGNCKHVNVSFIAIFQNNLLRESESVDESYTSSSRKFSTKPFMELAYMKLKLTALSEILDDSLDRFADRLP